MGSSPPIERLRTRVRQQEVVAELGRRALEVDDLDRLFDETAAAVADTLGTEYAGVFELRPGGDELSLRQGVGWRDDRIGSATVTADPESHGGDALHSAEPIVVEDFRTEERFSVDDCLVRDAVSGIGVGIGPVEDPWGVLGVHTTEKRAFADHEVSFVRSVANVLASAIENDRAERSLDDVYSRITDAFYALDEEWEFTSVNDRAAELIDPGGRGLVGTNIWEAFPAVAETTLEREYRRAMEREASTSFEFYHPGPIDSWFEIHAYPSETGLSVYFDDVTERKEYEQRLEQHRALTEAASDVIVTIDADSIVQAVNPAVTDVFGYRKDELIGESLTALIPDELVGRHREALARYLETGERTLDWEYVELPGVHADGHEIPLAVSFSEVEHEGERFFTGIIRDISERKEMERELRESEAKFRTLAENLQEVVWMSTADPTDIFYINPVYEEIWGRGRESLYENSLSFIEAIHPEDRERIRAAYTDLPDSEYDEEFRVVQPDGSVRWVHARAVPIRNDGESVRIVGIANDVTDRRERERELEESERRYRTLVENFPNGIVALFDEELRYTLAGGQLFEDLGTDSDESPDQAITDRYPDELVPEIEPHFRAALEGEAASFEVEYRSRNLFAQTLPVENAAGEVFAGMLVVQDITERTEARRKLEESNERLEQFAYAASHDLQEPLRMVSSYLTLVERRYADELDDDAEEFIEFAVDGAERMREMIEGLLEYSRVETQGDPFEPIDLDAVFEDVLTDLQVQIEETDAEITAEPLPRVSGDENQLRQVFQNLVSNAIEYSDDRPRVHVTADRDGSEWGISVHDKGIGIALDERDRVFRVFQRLHGVDEHSGTGIGLALCQRIVERHGGEIWVDSEPGEGSTFTFTLPVENERSD